MTEPETDTSYLVKLASPSFKRIIDALDLALYGLDEVSDEHRKRAFVGLVSCQDLDELYQLLKTPRDQVRS